KCKIATAVFLIVAALGFGGHGLVQALGDEPTQPAAKQEGAKQEKAKPGKAAQGRQKVNFKKAKSEGKGKPTLPLGPAPSQALVSISESGQLTVRTRETGYQVVQGQLGQQVMRMDEIKSRPYKVEEVQAFDMNIEPVDPKRLPKMLEKEIPALVVY